jgi:hypothetical protein
MSSHHYIINASAVVDTSRGKVRGRGIVKCVLFLIEMEIKNPKYLYAF